VDASDTYHPVFRRLFPAPPRVVVTSSLVVTEGHGWFLRRFDHVRTLQFLAIWSTNRHFGLTGTQRAIHRA
jgi:hypothetical protein